MSRRDEILDVATTGLEDRVQTRSPCVSRHPDGHPCPSLYKHVADKADILVGLQQRTLLGLAAHLEAAARAAAGIPET